MALNPQTTNREAVKTLVTIVLGLVILGAFIVFLGGHRFWEELDAYTIRFDTVKDLNTGRPVKFAGLEVGRVTSIGLDPERPGEVVVEIGIQQGFPLYRGTEARISQKGLVGDNYVALDLAGPAGPKLTPGSSLPATRARSVNEVAASMGDLIDSVRPRIESIAAGLERMVGARNQEQLNKLLTELPAAVAEARTMLASLDANVGAATGAVTDLSRTVGGSVSVLQEDISLLVADLRQVSARTGTAIETIDTFTRQLGSDLAYDQERFLQLVESLDAMARDLQSLARTLSERPWQVIYKPEGRAIP